MSKAVNVMKYIKEDGETKYKKVLDYKAKFHMWGASYEEFESGAGNFTAGVVERDNGQIELPSADMIQFIRGNTTQGATV